MDATTALDREAVMLFGKPFSAVGSAREDAHAVAGEGILSLDLNAMAATAPACAESRRGRYSISVSTSPPDLSSKS